MHQHVLVLGNQELVRHTVKVGNDQTLLALGVFTERNRTRDFGQHAGIFGRTGFKQLGHAWQTTGNVSSFLAFLRNTRQNFTHRHILVVAHCNKRANREADVYRMIRTSDLDFVALRVDQLHLWTLSLATGRTTLRINNNQGRQTGHIVDLLGYGCTLFDILEADFTGVFGHDWASQRIPGCQHRASFDLVTIQHGQCGTVRYLVTLTLAAKVVSDQHFARAGNHDLLALAVGHITHGGSETDYAV